MDKNILVEEWLGKDNQLGIDIWHNKYQYNDETFPQWLDRITAGNEDIKQLIIDKKFLFGGRILANRGLNKEGKKISLSNCYVMTPPEDNIESIFDCARNLARTYSYGGGCGVDLSKLSPRGAKVNNAAKATSGAVSFMDLYSMVTSLIGQNGRRGALMLSLSCEHPDIEEFIGVKSDLNKITKANISVRITDKFMVAVKNKQNFKLSFTREETGEIIEKTINAYDLFKKLCEMNWDYAEPGMLFWDRIDSWNLLSCDDSFSYAGTNPCAEEPLPAGGSCLLGSLNLSEFVTSNSTFDFESFRDATKKAVIALNEVLDDGLPLHPLKEQRDSVKDWRQIGLGIFGLADCLIKMKIKYGSKESLELCDKIGFHMADAALSASCDLSAKYGSYPKYNHNAVVQSGFLAKNVSELTRQKIEKYGLHNSQLLTIAPTGTLSTMLQISGGIEPIYANYYTRKTESLHGHDEYYKVYTKIVKDYMDNNNIQEDKYLPEFFVTATTLDYKDRINMQATWQNHIDASISSTVNVANDFTIEEVENLYLEAWEKGLKGVTIFRDGCKRTGILTTSDSKKEENEKELKRGEVIKVGNYSIGKERHLMTGCGSLHVGAFFDPDTKELLEVYLSKGSKGGCQSNLASMSRLISLAARAGVKVPDIIDQLESCPTCPTYAVRAAKNKDTSKGSSCPSAVGFALKEMYEQMKGIEFSTLTLHSAINTPKIKVEKKKNKCPQCGEELAFEGGCVTCKSCGYSKCE